MLLDTPEMVIAYRSSITKGGWFFLSTPFPASWGPLCAIIETGNLVSVNAIKYPKGNMQRPFISKEIKIYFIRIIKLY